MYTLCRNVWICFSAFAVRFLSNVLWCSKASLYCCQNLAVVSLSLEPLWNFMFSVLPSAKLSAKVFSRSMNVNWTTKWCVCICVRRASLLQHFLVLNSATKSCWIKHSVVYVTFLMESFISYVSITLRRDQVSSSSVEALWLHSSRKTTAVLTSRLKKTRT